MPVKQFPQQVEIAGKTPRSRISASLSRLSEDGFLVKTFEGGGNVPHKYKLRSAMSSDEVAEAEERMRLKHKRPNETIAEGGSPSNGEPDS